jgi:hypothetical protein
MLQRQRCRAGQDSEQVNIAEKPQQAYRPRVSLYLERQLAAGDVPVNGQDLPAQLVSSFDKPGQRGGQHSGRGLAPDGDLRQLAAGASSIRVECSISIRELYLRRTATSGPATVLFSSGCALTKTACASATLGATLAIPQIVMTAAAQQEASLIITLRMPMFS